MVSDTPVVVPSRETIGLLVFLLVVYAASAWRPADPATWWMEVFPVFLALPAVWVAQRRMGWTSLSLRLLTLEAVVVALGAHYTYAHVPLGFWISEHFGWSRNHYDRIAHFMQGAVPAIVVREVLLRTSPLRPGKWLFTIVAAMCLAFSAIYEFVEWGAAVLFAEGATEFLGTQGDPWDTQWDMFLALLGAMTSQLVFRRSHDRQLGELVSRRG